MTPPVWQYALAAAAVFGWMFVWRLVRRRLSDQPELPLEPRQPTPWGLGDVSLIILGFLLFSLVTPSLLGIGEDIESATLQQSLTMVTIVDLLTFVWALVVLKARGATWADMGIWPTRMRRDLLLGLIGFAVILVPVYVLQRMLVQWFADPHPAAKMFLSAEDPLAILHVVLVVSVVAPLVEEMLFRVVLQGWLETALGSMTMPMVDESGQIIEPAYTPAPSAMVISAFIFAAMHIRPQSADPIPLFIVALVLGYLYQRTHRIWPSLVMHVTLNSTSLLQLLAESGKG